MQVKFKLSDKTTVYYTPDGNFLLSKKDGTAVVLSAEELKKLAEVYPRAEESKHDMEL